MMISSTYSSPAGCTRGDLEAWSFVCFVRSRVASRGRVRMAVAASLPVVARRSGQRQAAPAARLRLRALDRASLLSLPASRSSLPPASHRDLDEEYRLNEVCAGLLALLAVVRVGAPPHFL